MGDCILGFNHDSTAYQRNNNGGNVDAPVSARKDGARYNGGEREFKTNI